MTVPDIVAAAKVTGDCPSTYQGHLLSRGRHRDWVAVSASPSTPIVGVARLVHCAWGVSPPHHAPNGWYFMGADVLPNFRGRGIAQQLSAARLEFVRTVASRVWAYTDEDNAAAIRTLARAGFERDPRPMTAPILSKPAVLFQRVF